MKKYLLLFLLVFVVKASAHAQVWDVYPMDSATVRFTADTIDYYYPDTATVPLWQIGRTTKSFFTADTSGVMAIMTDTIAHYPTNANNWFVLRLKYETNMIVDFWHRYQTDSGIDGGIVEFSKDLGVVWENVLGDCNIDTPGGGWQGVLTSDFYGANDTLPSGEPAFTGSSNSTVYSRVQFFEGEPSKLTSGGGCSMSIDSVFVRFRFVSDTVADTLAGWMIDSIKVEVDHWGFGGVHGIETNNALNVFPNPSHDGVFAFQAIENEREATMEIYNSIGQRVLQMRYSRLLDLSGLPRGLYYYKVGNGEAYYSGRLLYE